MDVQLLAGSRRRADTCCARRRSGTVFTSARRRASATGSGARSDSALVSAESLWHLLGDGAHYAQHDILQRHFRIGPSDRSVE